MRRAVLYLRVSTRDQVEHGDSIPAQRARLRKWAQDNGYQVVGEYIDAGESARVTDRPAFLRLIADAKAKVRAFDAIIVWKWDRFARNSEDAVLYKAMLRRELGVELIAVGEPQTEGLGGVIMERVIDVVAEFQSLMTGEHVHNTMTYLAKQGKWLAQPPYGYVIGEDGRLKPDPETAPAVQWMFEQFAAGRSATWLVRELAAGRPYPITAGRRWVVKTVKSILSNPAYIGTVRWNVRRFEVVPGLHNGGSSKKRMTLRDPSEWIEVPDAHPPLIDMKLWEDVQRRLAESSREPKATIPHPLRGLVKCFRCGGNMFFHAKWGGRQPRWECAKYYRVRPDDRCRPMVAITDAELSALVLRAIEWVTAGVAISPDDIVCSRRATEQRQRRLEALRGQRERLLQAYLAGVLDLDQFTTKRRELDQEIAELEQACEREPDLSRVMKYIGEAAQWVREIMKPGGQQLDLEEVRAALRSLIREITVIRQDRKKGTIRVKWWLPIAE